MLVYLKMVLFGQCEMNDHDECSGARLYTDVDGSRRVSVCTCNCHETEVVHVTTQPEKREPVQLQLPFEE